MNPYIGWRSGQLGWDGNSSGPALSGRCTQLKG